jgi:hypothetical protein
MLLRASPACCWQVAPASDHTCCCASAGCRRGFYVRDVVSEQLLQVAHPAVLRVLCACATAMCDAAPHCCNGDVLA